MEEQILIYVAGNPDAYPVEYYDPETESFQGVLPLLLADFSAQSRYKIVYYAAGTDDQREHLADNLQVDLVSGYVSGTAEEAGDILAFQAETAEGTVYCWLKVTDTAPEGLTSDLTAYFSSLSSSVLAGAALETTADYRPPQPAALPWIISGLVFGIAVLAAALALTVRRYRKRIHTAQQEQESDAATGLNTLETLRRYFPQLVHDENRSLYSLICFRVEAELPSGHSREAFLRHCAVTLREYAADTDLLASVPDGSFVLLKLAENAELLPSWADVVLRKIRAYPRDSENPAGFWAAAGIYPIRAEDKNLDEILFLADQEARRALRERWDVSVFSNETLRHARLERNLSAAVDGALKHSEFQLYIQFYVDAYTYRIVGGEALSRWHHPVYGVLKPKDFVPMLEREGRVYLLDYQCLRSSCDFLQALCNHGITDFFLSCNFSRETFAADDFVERCLEILEGYRFPRELLIFELTESAAVQNLSVIRDHMAALKQAGFRVALDDFGEGFTSFRDLQAYPVDGVKLDKELVDNVLTKTGHSILRGMVQVGHEMDITILAEGVESQEQAEVLRDLHCDVLQGFRFYAPVPREEAMEHVLSHAGRRAEYAGS